MTTILIPALMSFFLAAPTGDSGEPIKLFWATYNSTQSTDAARIEAIHGLGAQPTSRGAKVLGKLLITAPDRHRMEASRALSQFREIKGVSVLVARALRHRGNQNKTGVRVALIKTLGSLKEQETLRLLHKLLEDKNLRISQAVIHAIPGFQNKKSVNHLIRALRKFEKMEGTLAGNRTLTLNRALKHLTGRSFHHSKEWSQWWGSMDVQTSVR